MLTTNEKLKILAGRAGLSMAALADKLGESRQNFHNKLKRENFTERQLREIADTLGCDVEVVFTSREDGEKL